MILSAFQSLWKQLVVVCGVLGVCALFVWLSDGIQASADFLQTTVLRMKGPWVWTFGWGLSAFIGKRGRLLPAALNGVLVANDATALVTANIERSTLHRNALRYTVPITLLGVCLTFFYGIPNTGLAQSFIFIGVCSIYYVAAFLLFHFVEVTLAFQRLFDSMEKVEFKVVYNPMHLENLTTYLAITSTFGLIAIYAGFRGTVTAGFQFKHEVWKAFLSTPLIAFLPGTLFYNYYPRYVLKKIVQHRVFIAMERLGNADEQSAKALLISLKDCSFTNSQILPFLDYKSMPSYLLAIFFVISLAYNNDPAVKAFVNFLVTSGSP